MKKKIFVKWLRILSSALILASLVLLGIVQVVFAGSCEKPGSGCHPNNNNKDCCPGLTCISDVPGNAGHCSDCPADYTWNASAEKCQIISDEPICGNEKLESGEVCDDGNTQSGDGCSSTCTRETCNDVCEKWSEWSSCDKDGEQYRTRTCNGTLSCATKEIQTCVPIDCDGCCGDWSAWSKCDPSSEYGYGEGEQIRGRSCDTCPMLCLTKETQSCCVPATEAYCPTDCGHLEAFDIPDGCGGFVICPATGECPENVDCEGYWGLCIGECGTTGLQTFYITTYPSGEGEECEYEGGDTQDCQTEACPVNLCGNGKLDPGESCDDGNRINGDGCNASCASEITVPPVIPVTGGTGGPDGALLIPVTGVDLTTCALQSKYLSLSKVFMYIGVGCFGVSLVMDGFAKKKG